METFSALLAICAENSPVTDELPTQRPVPRSFDVSLISAWIKGWVNNREAGSLGRNHVHYDVTVMNSSVEKSALLSVHSTKLNVNLTNRNSNHLPKFKFQFYFQPQIAVKLDLAF